MADSRTGSEPGNSSVVVVLDSEELAAIRTGLINLYFKIDEGLRVRWTRDYITELDGRLAQVEGGLEQSS